MIFITSDIQVLATITDIEGHSFTISVKFQYETRGLFKEEMERILLKQFNRNGKRVIKIRIH